MSDIFISYSRQDKEWVGALASTLQERGWSVWWDIEILTGEKFSQVIETELNNARCVIVVWSKQSVDSDWVQAEASEARRRGVLVPITIDDANPPLIFRQLLTANFSDWEGKVESVQFEKLVQDIASHMDASCSSTLPETKSKTTKHMQQKEQAKITLATYLARSAIETKKQFIDQSEKTSSYWWYFMKSEGGDELLQRSVLLAVESMRLSPSLDAEKALRDGLILLTRTIAELKCRGFKSSCLSISQDGKYAATIGPNNKAFIWETNNWQEAHYLRHKSEVRALAFSPDGQTLATGSKNGTTRLWNAVSGKELFELENIKMVEDVAFSPDGCKIAAGGSDGYALIWNVTDGKILHRLKHTLPSVGKVLFNPSGQTLVTVNNGRHEDSAVHLWDIKSAELLATNKIKAADVALSPNGKYLAIASASFKDGSVYLWDATTMKQVARLEHERSALQSVAFSPDGKYLVSTGTDGSARLWALPDGDEVFHVNHQDRVIIAAFSADSAYFVTGSQDGTAKVVSVPAGKEVARLNNPGNISAVRFSPDGQYVITASEKSGSARVWRFKFDDPLVEACRRVSRNLSVEEWRKYFGDTPYRKTCPDKP